MATTTRKASKSPADTEEPFHPAPTDCVGGVCDPERTQGLQAPASPQDAPYDLITLRGPGLFLAAQISKQGGKNDLTFVNLDVDGRNVTSLSYAAAANWGLTQQNPYGLVLLQTSGTIKTMAIGFSAPLLYRRDLRLSVIVKETNVTQILANVVHGAA